MSSQEKLLRQASECYLKAGLIDDACRCFEKLDDYAKVADLYEQQQRWEKAALGYRSAQLWHEAARCYLRCEQPIEAAQCFLNGNDPFQAAWIFAQQAHLFNRARSILQQVTIESLADELSRDLILARCEAGNGRYQQAGIYLHGVISQFEQLAHKPHCQQIEQWAVAVAEQIERPDLIASIYAAAYLAGNPKAEQRWEAWAMESLGDATGVPLTPSLELFEFEVVTVNERGEIINRRRHQASQYTEDVNGMAIEMVYVPGGTFLMGSPETEAGRNNGEGPQHQVTVAPFYMCKYPITQAQWQAVMGNNPSEFKEENHPVENVSWDDAMAFCQKLSELTGKDYRLPSEAQWEYAGRGGTTTPFYFGETIITNLANYYGDYYPYASGPKGVYREETTEVGIFPPNAFGLYDMHGNVWEWCADPWHDNYQGAPSDGRVWEKLGYLKTFVLRGGSWGSFARWTRSAGRIEDWPSERNGSGGFRLIRT